MSIYISPRIWGRVYADDGSYTWQVVTPDDNGNTDNVYLTNLIQVLKLSTGESPFFANYGIPAQRSVIQQIFPDYYVSVTQQQFAQFFTSLQVTKQDNPEPTYDISVITNQGRSIQLSIPV